MFSYTIDSPLGRVMLVATDTVITHVHLPDGGASEPFPERETPLLLAAAAQLREYFAGARTVFELPLGASGTEFQHRVWRALATIPFAATWSYGQLARAIGQPTASRAVGAANGANPLAIVVPCHRVIGTNGTLTGYAGGMEAKQWLLSHERRIGGGQAELPL